MYRSPYTGVTITGVSKLAPQLVRKRPATWQSWIRWRMAIAEHEGEGNNYDGFYYPRCSCGACENHPKSSQFRAETVMFQVELIDI